MLGLILIQTVLYYGVFLKEFCKKISRGQKIIKNFPASKELSHTAWDDVYFCLRNSYAWLVTNNSKTCCMSHMGDKFPGLFLNSGF